MNVPRDYRMSRTLKLKDMLGVFVMTILMLMIPFIAMRFSKDVDWQLSDFVIMGILLTLTGTAIVYSARKIRRENVRLAFIITILITFALTWGELSVGIFGTPFAGD